MNAQDLNATEARSKIFSSLIIKEGTLKRGVVISRMHVSEQIFSKEYLTYLDIYPTIHYNKETREFTYQA